MSLVKCLLNYFKVLRTLLHQREETAPVKEAKELIDEEIRALNDILDGKAGFVLKNEEDVDYILSVACSHLAVLVEDFNELNLDDFELFKVVHFVTSILDVIIVYSLDSVLKSRELD